MNQHNGMRPQDIAILLKIVISPDWWMNKDLSLALKISASEISYSLQRSSIAGLLDHSKRKVMRGALLDFIQYGLPYVFPALKGSVTRGVPTAYSAPVMSGNFLTNEHLVWPHPNGKIRGEAVMPLYPKAVEAALDDDSLYDLLALVDVMRLGKVREREMAMRILKEKLERKYA